MWLLVWVVLVLAALSAAALLGRRLWRQAKDLGREVSRSLELTARLSPAGADPATPDAAGLRHAPGPVGDEATLERARADRARVKADRAADRAARLGRATARWRGRQLI